MQVILLEKVANLGNLGDVVRVKDGFARNFLIPQRKARRATETAIADFEALASKVGIKIIDRVVLHEGKEVNWLANLFGSLAIYRVQSA